MNAVLKLTAASAIAFACALAVQAEEARKTQDVTWEDILNDSETTDDVLMYGMGNNAQRDSTRPRSMQNTSGICTRPGRFHSAMKRSVVSKHRLWCMMA